MQDTLRERYMLGIKQKKPALSQAIRTYLLCYNVAQFLGCSLILYRMVTFYAAKGTFEGLWPTIAGPAITIQTAALLEVAHAAFGMTSSRVMLTFWHILSRVGVVCLVPHMCPEVSSNPWVTFTLLCWILTDLIRYLFYFSNLINSRSYVLLWLRYTLFIVLYPCGVTGELSCIYLVFPYYVKMFTVQKTNMLNLTFYFPYALIIFALLYIPGIPRVYLHLFAQRKKMLGAAVREYKTA